MAPFRRRSADEHKPARRHVGDATAELDALIRRASVRITGPGNWLAAGERVQTAIDARITLLQERPGHTRGAHGDVVERIALAPHTIRRTDVTRWEQRGLTPLAYAEVVSIVGQIAALDTVCFALGLRLARLRPASDARPHGHVVDAVQPGAAFVPTIGRATGPNMLSGVPDEAEAVEEAQQVLYLPLDRLHDVQATRDGLQRAQIELVAARTAALNECVPCLLGHASMLRATAGRPFELQSILRGIGDPGVEHGPELLAFCDATVLRDRDEIEPARAGLVNRIGAVPAARVAMIAANFAMMSRISMALGSPIDHRHAQLAELHGLELPPHLVTEAANA